MKTLQKLLAATDLSDSSLVVVDRGFQIAQRTGAHYSVIHALGVDLLGSLTGLSADLTLNWTRRATEQAHKVLEQQVAEAGRDRGVAAAIHLDTGTAMSAITAHAADGDTDLVLVGAHGRDFWQRFVLGSTTSRLLRRSPCSVLVVKQAGARPYRRALVAMDFSPASALAIDLTLQVAPDAELVLLHVLDLVYESLLRSAGTGEEQVLEHRIAASARAMGQLQDAARSAGLPDSAYTALVLHGDPKRQIVAQEQAGDCDLVVMGKHGTQLYEEMLIGSVTKRVLAESQSDVLVLIDNRPPASVDI